MLRSVIGSVMYTEFIVFNIISLSYSFSDHSNIISRHLEPGNVKLKPEILGDHQKYAAEQLKNGDEKPL